MRILFNLFWLYLLSFPQIHPIFLSTQFCFFYSPSIRVCVAQDSLMHSLLLESGQLTRGYTLRENSLSLSQQLEIANSSSARDRAVCPAPLSMRGFNLAWACAVLFLLSQRYCFLLIFLIDTRAETSSRIDSVVCLFLFLTSKENEGLGGRLCPSSQHVT